MPQRAWPPVQSILPALIGAANRILRKGPELSKQILVVQNALSSPIGLVGEVFEEDGVTYDLLRPFEDDSLPATPNGYDGLVVLGGPQNALADDTHPYLPDLAALTRAFGDEDKAVAGICLGAQIIARAYDAENILDKALEFGFHTVHPLNAAKDDPVIGVLREPLPVFQWHADTFTLPEGATLLASSDMTPHQTMRLERAVYAFQFHFELTPQTLDMWRGLAAERFGDNRPGWQEQFTSLRQRHASNAERFGRSLTRAWLAQV